jgi:hypothetical protein
MLKEVHRSREIKSQNLQLSLFNGKDVLLRALELEIYRLRIMRKKKGFATKNLLEYHTMKSVQLMENIQLRIVENM